MSKLHPIFEQAPFLKPVATGHGPLEPKAQPKDERVYGEWCRNPQACKGKGVCLLDPSCGD